MEATEVYNKKSVVAEYAIAYELQLPEITIINKLSGQLQNFTMLDIGVGTGRTTTHFAPMVKEYIGVDYAPLMIDECKKRYSHYTNAKFLVADARNMNEFLDNSFDFILFSFNGIDSVKHTDRELILKEIQRIAKDKALFVFSSHNIHNIPLLFSLKFAKHPINMLHNLKKNIRLRLNNISSRNLIKKDYAYVCDGVHNFSLTPYYIKPSYQIQQLNKLGFKQIEVYNIENGNIVAIDSIDTITSPWVYYKCEI